MNEIDKKFFRKHEGDPMVGEFSNGTRKGERRSGEDRRKEHCFIANDRRGKERRKGDRRQLVEFLNKVV